MDKIKYDAEYISYVETGESAAVFVVRDVVKSIDTSKMWIDVLNIEGDKNRNGRWDFRYFTIELFPRRKYPQYPHNASDHVKKYITWKTAHEDITEQRGRGYKGAKFRIDTKLVNRNRGKYRKVKEAWNLTFDQWVPNEWFGPSCEWKERKVLAKPKWDYDILEIRRL